MVILIVLGGTLFALIAAAVVMGRQRRPSTQVRVPVDDFVVGDFPLICAVSGETADGLVSTESDRTVFQAWWLLLLFGGPVGLVIMAVLYALASRPIRVGGTIPMTHAALHDQNRISGWTGLAWLVPFVVVGAGAVFLAFPLGASPLLPEFFDGIGVGLLMFSLVGGLASMVILNSMYERRSVQVHVEAGGRWVVLENVHPTFAQAVTAQTRARHRAKNADRVERD